MSYENLLTLFLDSSSKVERCKAIDFPMDDAMSAESMDDLSCGEQDTPFAVCDFPMEDSLPVESMDDLRDFRQKCEMAQIKADRDCSNESPVPFPEKQGEILQHLPKRASAYTEIARQLMKMRDFMRLNKTLYLKVGVVWRKIDKDDIADLFDNLPHEVADGLDDAAAKGIYGKIYQQSSIRLSSEDLVENPNLIPLLDGFYDIENRRVYDTGQMPDSFLCLNAAVREIGKGSARAYDAFLSSTFSDDAAIMRFEETQGAILTTHTLKNIFLYKGERDSGKSVIEKLDIELLKNTSGYGDEQQHIMPIDNINRLSKQFGLGDAPDRWLIVCGDASKVAINDNTAAILKQLSGNDYIRGELKHANAKGGFFKGRILLLSNHPLHGAIDDALKSRIIMTPFLNSIPKEAQIPDLHNILYEERGQILYRYFCSFRRLLDNNFNYTQVDERDSWAGESPISVQDTVDSFVTQRTIRDPRSYAETKMLYIAYRKFCEKEYLTAISDSGAFGRYLRASCPWLEPSRSSKSRGYMGIKLKNF